MTPPPERDLLETPADYEVLARVAFEVDPDWAEMVLTVAGTGMRWGEAVQLGPASVNAHRHLLRLTERFSAVSGAESGRKNGEFGVVPVPEWVMTRILVPRVNARRPLIFTGPNGNRWSYSTDWDRWFALRKGLKKAGLPVHLTHHCLRHSYRTWLDSKKISKEKIDMVMGHKNRSMSARYTGLTAADRVEIQAAITELLPESIWPKR